MCAPKLFMMAQLEHGHCTARSTILAAPPAKVKDKSGEGGQTTVGLDPINESVQRGRAGMARQRSRSQDVRTDTWNVRSMISRSGEVVDALHRRKIDLCCDQETRWKGESARMPGACVRSSMTYGSETMPLLVDVGLKFEKAEMQMIRWMCGISLKDRRTNEELRRLVGVDPITNFIRGGRLRWYGHVMRTG